LVWLCFWDEERDVKGYHELNEGPPPNECRDRQDRLISWSAINPRIAKVYRVEGNKEGSRNDYADSVANWLTAACVGWVIWVKHVDSPAINGDVLTGDEESIENQECRKFVDFFFLKHLVDREVKVVQDHTAN
jgi:hypothetical protein